MSVYHIAASPVWWGVTSLAVLLIYVDWTPRTKRRLIIAAVLAVAATVGIYAAEITDPYYYCTVPPISEYPFYIRWALGCP